LATAALASLRAAEVLSRFVIPANAGIALDARVRGHDNIGSRFSQGAGMLASIRNATKIYGQHKALNNVTFELAAGEVHCLVGENGAASRP
jgi:ABC-type glutathione transport system ATPase component